MWLGWLLPNNSFVSFYLTLVCVYYYCYTYLLTKLWNEVGNHSKEGILSYIIYTKYWWILKYVLALIFTLVKAEVLQGFLLQIQTRIWVHYNFWLFAQPTIKIYFVFDIWYIKHINLLFYVSCGFGTVS